MSYKHAPLAWLVAQIATSALFAQNPHGDPYEPVGSLTVTPTVVQVGVRPEMFWNIEYPEAVGDLVDLGPGSHVLTNKDLRVKVRVAGVALQSGTTHLPAGIWVRVGGGSWELLFYGTASSVNPSQFVFDRVVPKNTRIDFAARGKRSDGQWYSSRWTVSNMAEVVGLRNGQAVPSYAPAYDQGNVEDFLTQYLADTDGDGSLNVVLGPRDMIYLFELASTDPGEWFYDMQDLVAVVTFDDPGTLDEEDPSADDYVNFIRQIQQDSGVEWDVTVDPEGDRLSPEGVGVEGSFFQLWSLHAEAAEEYLLDEQFVTAYTPNGEITIETEDPYELVARTRVDQPFSVTFDVRGLLPPGPEVPLAAQQVAISHEAYTYPEGEHSLENVEDPEGTIIQQGYLSENGEAELGFSVTNLPADDLTRVEGEEVFTISALADYSVSATVLDSKRLQVWPIARAELSGYDPNQSYDSVPSIRVTLSDLYPASATYLRIYRGTAQLDPPNPRIVTASYVLINDSITQAREFSLEDLDDYLAEEGLYTMEILHETPFGTDLLQRSAIRVDRTLRVNGALFSTD